MELGGWWRAVEADDALRRVFPDPDLDDGGWAELAVPGHWQSAAPFAGSHGPLLYRRRFESPATSGQRVWLDLDGLFYQGDVWLDGSYLGDTEGYFFPHHFEITELIRDRTEHLLAVEVACPRPSDKRAKRNLTGVFQHWDCFDQDWNPGGIWRPVRLTPTGSVRLSRLRVLCREATAERATLDLRAELDATEATAVTLATTVSPSGDRAGEPVAEREAEQPLAAGCNVVRWRVAVERPELWWPHALGDQALYNVTVSVACQGEQTDARTVTTGLRQVRMKNFITTVNHERLYLKGANQGPSRRALGEATADDLEHDVRLAREAGLDLLRIHGHISRPELYAAADRHGLLLWQDMPLQWGYSGQRRQAARQAAQAVDLLGHHPSIAIWCGHNEPFAIDVDPVVYAPGSEHAGPNLRTRTRLVVGQTFPSWNKTGLDRSIRRAVEKADGSRPVVAHSGVVPHPAWGTDSHLYYGWYHGEEREFPRALARFPVMARFVSEFGAQAVPNSAAFCEPERWPELDWVHLARAHCLQKSIFDRYVPPADHPTFESWRAATQAYQATVIRHHIETLRRLKYRPTGGFCQFCFADGQAAVTWSVLDHDRNPKAGFEALAAACAPVIVVADRPAAAYGPRSQIALDLHVVSDLRTPLERAQVRAELNWPGGARTWWFEGDVHADSCSRVGRLVTTLPPGVRPGPLVLELDLQWAGGKVTNRYDSFLT